MRARQFRSGCPPSRTGSARAFSDAIALILAISAELLAGADTGVGAWILRAGSGGANADLVYAGTMFTGVLGLVLNQVLQSVERRALGWRLHLAAAT